MKRQHWNFVNQIALKNARDVALLFGYQSMAQQEKLNVWQPDAATNTD